MRTRLSQAPARWTAVAGTTLSAVLMVPALSACSSKSPVFVSGPYRALTPSGQAVDLALNLAKRTGELEWGKAVGSGPGVPVTVVTKGNTITLQLGDGLRITGRANGPDHAFRLTYPQHPDGEPHVGSPVHTLDFTIIPSA